MRTETRNRGTTWNQPEVEVQVVWPGPFCLGPLNTPSRSQRPTAAARGHFLHWLGPAAWLGEPVSYRTHPHPVQIPTGRLDCEAG